MKDEIKEILDKLKDTADTSFFAVCDSQEELDKMPRSITKILSIPSKDAQILLDYITNLQDKVEWYENIEINKTIDKFRLEHNKEIKRLNKENEKLKEGK